MASKQPRFTRKVYECWAYHVPGGKIREYPNGLPVIDAAAHLAVTPIPVRVTVERIERNGSQLKKEK